MTMPDDTTLLTKLGPDFYVVRHTDWEAFSERKTEAAYEQLDDLFDKARIPIDIVAGMIYVPSERRIYADENIALPALDRNEGPGEGLSKHEFGHFKGDKHPTSFFKGLVHAHQTGYTYRAYTRWLRRNHKPSPAGWSEWWSEVRRLRRIGLIVPRIAPR